MNFRQVMRLLRSESATRSIGIRSELNSNTLSKEQHADEQRRLFLSNGLACCGFSLLAPTILTSCGTIVIPEKIKEYFSRKASNLASLGPLQEPDENGIRLPAGFTSRIVANSDEEVIDGGGFQWHWAPDGGAVFAIAGGGWIYVSNSEMSGGTGGVGAIVFGSNGDIRNAYSILQGTSRNCAGGKTPWGTWLSCEEVSDGHVWECDPRALVKPRKLKALGTFSHEAVAFEPVKKHFYLTEDEEDGRLYRFRSDIINNKGYPDLTKGILEVAEITGESKNNVIWHELLDPNAKREATRYQIKVSSAFNGGEGIDYLDGNIYFGTKGDNRIWKYNVAANTMSVFYDVGSTANPVLSGIDNIVAVETGELIVAEDGGDMELIVMTMDGELHPLLQVVGQSNSEITGQAFNHHGDKLYFSSQRGKTGTSAGGITYEISGPFFS